MNDFTKEELKKLTDAMAISIWRLAVFNHSIDNELDLIKKLQSMIENYGDNKMTDTFRKAYNDDVGLKELAIEIKSMAEGLEEHIKLIGKTRETSLALTNLELAVMWAVKAIYIEADKNE